MSANINCFMAGGIALTFMETATAQAKIALMECMEEKLYQTMTPIYAEAYQLQFKAQEQKAQQQITQGWVQFGSDMAQAVSVLGMTAAGEYASQKPLNEAEALEKGPIRNEAVLTEVTGPTVVEREAAVLEGTLQPARTGMAVVEGEIQQPAHAGMAVIEGEIEQPAAAETAVINGEIEQQGEARVAAETRDEVVQEAVREEETPAEQEARHTKIRQLHDKSNIIKQQFNAIFAPAVQNLLRSVFSATSGYVAASITRKEADIQLLSGIAEGCRALLSNISSYLQLLQQNKHAAAQAAQAMIQISSAA